MGPVFFVDIAASDPLKCGTMRFQTLICAVLALATLSSTSCQSTGSTSTSVNSILTNKQVTADAQIALKAAAAYEAVKKKNGKVTVSDYEQIALQAVSDYAAVQASAPSQATLTDWLALANQAVALYDASKGKAAQ